MTARVESATSVLLSDPPPVLVAPALLRGLGLLDRDPDYLESLRLGLTESLDEYDARIGGA
ncbi:hypothetical protein ACIBEA_30125 [Streptomyces sp. NPDC051555]|uniref:hypothetical protein n=1 Tax=Streptomyces sp. NPDC051555 TaxID=3365657 RepID=UPI0037B3A5A5